MEGDNKRAIVQYETSEGLEEIIFENADNVRTNIENGVFTIKEQSKELGYKELVIISLNSFVSYQIK